MSTISSSASSTSEHLLKQTRRALHRTCRRRRCWAHARSKTCGGLRSDVGSGDFGGARADLTALTVYQIRMLRVRRAVWRRRQARQAHSVDGSILHWHLRLQLWRCMLGMILSRSRNGRLLPQLLLMLLLQRLSSLLTSLLQM